MKIVTLKQRKDFLNIAKNGNKVVTKGLVIQALNKQEDVDQHLIRVGYTTSKKLGKAVTRNLVKRRMRAIVAEIFPEMAKPGFDYSLIGRYNTKDRDYVKLKQDLKYALNTLHN